MKYLVTFVGVVSWLAGVVLAKAGWLSVAAFVMPVYAWYLVVAKVMVHLGWA